jgi:hypothetical protein
LARVTIMSSACDPGPSSPVPMSASLSSIPVMLAHTAIVNCPTWKPTEEGIVK